MKALGFVALTTMLYAIIPATTPSLQLRWRVKRAESNSSRYVYRANEEESKTANLSPSITDACNASMHANSDYTRRRRSVEYPSSDDSNATKPPAETSIDLSVLSPEFLNCTHIYIEPECYEKLDNGLVYIPLYSMTFDRANYIINGDLLFICPDFFNEFPDADKFPEEIQIVSLVCAIISTVCITLHVIMFVLVKSLRNLPGYCLLSLCFALVAAYVCTFVQAEISDEMGCTVLGMFLMYFFLASFCWMNTMAYDVWKSIRMATAKLRLTTNRPIMVQFARYSFYAWGVPLTIVITSIIIHHSAPDTSKYKLIFNISNCWFRYKQALTLYFAGPLFTLLGMNVIFFVSSFLMISNASMSKSGSQRSSDLWSRLFLSLRLSSVMGFMWIFGIIATITRQEWMWYLYSVCSALQGVFIFFSFTLSERTRRAFQKTLRGRKCSVMPTQITSSQQTSTV